MKEPVKFTPIERIRARRLFYYLRYMIRKLQKILFILFGNIVIGGLLLSWLDGKSLAEGQYLSFITAMTIGYGDYTSFSPCTPSIPGQLVRRARVDGKGNSFPFHKRRPLPPEELLRATACSPHLQRGQGHLS